MHGRLHAICGCQCTIAICADLAVLKCERTAACHVDSNSRALAATRVDGHVLKRNHSRRRNAYHSRSGVCALGAQLHTFDGKLLHVGNRKRHRVLSAYLCLATCRILDNDLGSSVDRRRLQRFAVKVHSDKFARTERSCYRHVLDAGQKPDRLTAFYGCQGRCKRCVLL